MTRVVTDNLTRVIFYKKYKKILKILTKVVDSGYVMLYNGCINTRGRVF